MRHTKYLLIPATILLLAGCSAIQSLGNQSQKSSDFDLAETYKIPNFDFSLNYPESWFVATDDTVTWIRQDEEDFNHRYEDNRRLNGIGITFDHRSLDWLTEAFGLTEYPTLNDLFQLNIEEISHMVNPTIHETSIFGVDALQSEFYGEQEQWYISYAGYLDEEAFHFQVAAPSEKALDEFKPTWTLIVESITRIKE